MARHREVKNIYHSGELDPRLHGRADNKHYFNGAEKMRNTICLPQGGWTIRPGLERVATLTPTAFRLIPFRFGVTQRYMILLTDGAFRVYKRGVLIATVSSQPWTAAQLPDIGWAHELNTLIIFHEAFRPRAITRDFVTEATWTGTNWELNNIPRFAFPATTYVNGVDEVQELLFQGTDWAAGNPFTLSLGGEETTSIEYHATPATLASNIQTALRALSITSATGITAAGAAVEAGEVTVTMGGDDGDRPWGEIAAVIKAPAASDRSITVTVETKGEFAGEDTWSATRGWPKCGEFFQGRLWMAGSTQRPGTVWASRAGDPNDFNIKETSDDYGIEVTADGSPSPSFRQIFAGRHLQFFADSGEFYVPVSDTDTVTPTNISLRQTTSAGIKRGLPVFDVEGATVFVQQSSTDDDSENPRGVGVGLREYIFSDAAQAYDANDISILATHLIRDPVRVAIRRKTASDDSDYYLSVNDDGTLTWFCTLRSQDVNGFTLAETEGTFLDVGVDGETIYVMVSRVVDGVTVYFLERFVDGLYVDCGIYDNDIGAAEASATAAWLADEEVEIRVDGLWEDAQVASAAGVVTFASPAEENYQVGLGWPVVDDEDGIDYVYLVRDLPIAAELADGPIMGKKRRNVEITVKLLETETLLVKGNRISGRRFGDTLLDVPIPAITGERRIRGLLGWDMYGRVAYGDTRPGPVTVLAAAKVIGI